MIAVTSFIEAFLVALSVARAWGWLAAAGGFVRL
jgi:hypothetical protein